jgi:hypothetical protein
MRASKPRENITCVANAGKREKIGANPVNSPLLAREGPFELIDVGAFMYYIKSFGR